VVTLYRSFFRKRVAAYLQLQDRLCDGHDWDDDDFQAYAALASKFGVGPRFNYTYDEEIDDENLMWGRDKQWQRHPALLDRLECTEDLEQELEHLEQEWDIHEGRHPADACKPGTSVARSQLARTLLEPWRFASSTMLFGRGCKALAIPNPAHGNEATSARRTEQEVFTACRALNRDPRVQRLALRWCVRPPDWRLLHMRTLVRSGAHLWFAPEEGFVGVFKTLAAAEAAVRKARMRVLLNRIRSWIEAGWDPTFYKPGMGLLDSLKKPKVRWSW